MKGTAELGPANTAFPVNSSKVRACMKKAEHSLAKVLAVFWAKLCGNEDKGEGH